MSLSNYPTNLKNSIKTAYVTSNLTQISSEAAYPTYLQAAKNISSFKEDKKSVPCNYRPIFVITNLEKCFKNILSKIIIIFKIVLRP